MVDVCAQGWAHQVLQIVTDFGRVLDAMSPATRLLVVQLVNPVVGVDAVRSAAAPRRAELLQTVFAARGKDALAPAAGVLGLAHRVRCPRGALLVFTLRVL